MAASASAADMLPQLESARKLALADAQVYTQVIPGILPIIGPTAPVEVRRWGADFLAEGFASPNLPQSRKEELVTEVVPVLKGMLDGLGGEDAMVVKSAVMAAGSVYPLVFRRVISHPDQTLLWQDTAAIKLHILQRMDTAPASVRICCIKFVQKVVQVQTPGLISDPRRPDNNETSLALVPRNHPLLPVANIEAETSGLTDRLLSVLQEQSGDPLLVDATMNCLAVLIKTRPAVANKILSVVLGYNPFKYANSPLTPRSVVILKSLERTTRALLRHIMRVFPNHPLGDKIHTYLQRLEQSRNALFAETHNLKRPAEAADGSDSAKRQRMSTEPRRYPPMPPPPNTVAHLFTLTTDTMLQQFDVKLLQVDLVSNINGLLLQHIDSKTLDEAIEVVRQRHAALQQAAQNAYSQVPLAGPTGIDDEDDYDPEFLSASDTTVALATEKALEELAAPVIELGPFELPRPPPLSATEVALLSDQTVGRVFDVAASFDRVPASARQKSGINRLAASASDREAWITILTRLATRAPAGLDDFVSNELADDSEAEGNSNNIKRETIQPTAENTVLDVEKPDMSSRIRQTLFRYILEDWRPRINIALSWLTEEWYADRLATNSEPIAQEDFAPESALLPNYTRTLTRLLTYLLPRFDASDSKLLIRFLSEVPHISAEILDQVRRLARDPGTVKICVLALQYLVLFRPPVRDLVLDCLTAIWVEGDDGVRDSVGKVLNKWRPNFEERLQSQTKDEVEEGQKMEDIRKEDETAENDIERKIDDDNEGKDGKSTGDVVIASSNDGEEDEDGGDDDAEEEQEKQDKEEEDDTEDEEEDDSEPSIIIEAEQDETQSSKTNGNGNGNININKSTNQSSIPSEFRGQQMTIPIGTGVSDGQ